MQLLERLVNLVALLLDARLPLTFDEIRERMAEAYEQDETDSAKRMFERDKDILRDIGVPIEVVTTDVWETTVGYVIPKDRYYLPEISFAPEEISALFVAAHSGREDRSAEDAVRKLLSGSEGGILAGVAGVPLAPEGETPEGRLTAAAEGVAERRSVRFSYRTARGEASDRRVDAYGLVVRGGHWYLVGLDRDRDEIRAFRLSRLSSDLADAGEGSDPPEGFRAADHVQAGPWGPGEPQERARVAFSPDVAWWAVNGIQGSEEVLTRANGWVEILVPSGPGEGLASWVLSFGPDAEALEPPELREEVVRRLEATLAAL
jgi:proteasome accessory factor B